LDLFAFSDHLTSRLPKYAQPVFLRIRNEMELTSTFKYTKTDLAREGYDPSRTSELIYFNHPGYQAFIRLDKMLCEQIESGRVRI
jgi:fatty-acyl-CoA synthase